MWKLRARGAPVSLTALCAIGGQPPSAVGADIDQWAICMGGGGPASAIQACSAIIDSHHELPDSLPYAFVYRGRAHLTQKHADLALSDFTAALKFRPEL